MSRGFREPRRRRSLAAPRPDRPRGLLDVGLRQGCFSCSGGPSSRPGRAALVAINIDPKTLDSRLDGPNTRPRTPHLPGDWRSTAKPPPVADGRKFFSTLAQAPANRGFLGMSPMPKHPVSEMARWRSPPSRLGSVPREPLLADAQHLARVATGLGPGNTPGPQTQHTLVPRRAFVRAAVRVHGAGSPAEVRFFRRFFPHLGTMFALSAPLRRLSPVGAGAP